MSNRNDGDSERDDESEYEGRDEARAANARDFVQSAGERQARDEHAESSRRHQRTQSCGAEREHERLREHLSRKPPRARTERGANAHLGRAVRRSRKDERRRVCARDEQQQRDRSEEEQQRLSDLTKYVRVHRYGGGVASVIPRGWVRETLVQRSGESPNFGVHLRFADSASCVGYDGEISILVIWPGCIHLQWTP